MGTIEFNNLSQTVNDMSERIRLNIGDMASADCLDNDHRVGIDFNAINKGLENGKTLSDIIDGRRITLPLGEYEQNDVFMEISKKLSPEDMQLFQTRIDGEIERINFFDSKCAFGNEF
ncbi:MAG: hypothetical protein COA45_09270 [Zetaproteobacteria bacterium]|nr:MAG: hypothetical protein COA45_09270 [Zetaproteobacteria bacterium]